MRMRSFFAPRHLQPLRAIHTPSSALPSSLRAAQQSHEDKQLRALLQLQLRRMLSIGVCLLVCLIIFTYGSYKGIKWFGQLILLALVLLPTLWLWLKELPLRVLRLLRKRRIALGDLINMAIAEWQRPAQTRLPLAEINDNASLLAWLAASRPRAVLCFRAGLLISPAALAAGVPFYNVHAAELPEFGGLGAIARALRAGRQQGQACLHHMVERIDAGEVLDREPYALDRSDSYGANEARAYAAAERLLWRTLERL